MLAGEPGRFFIPAKRATAAMSLVRYHRFAVARAAEHNATFTFAACHCLRGWANEKRIIYRFLTERAEVFYFVTECAEQFFHFLFVAKSGVICAERNFHVLMLLVQVGSTCRGELLPCHVERSRDISYCLIFNSRFMRWIAHQQGEIPRLRSE